MALEAMLISLFSGYSNLLAFLAGLLAGDIILILSILAGAGKANIFLIVLFGFIGGVIHDAVFYYIANSRLMHFIKNKFKLSKNKNKAAQFIEKISSRHYFLPVLIAKFIYGVRDAVILYVAHNNRSFKRYIFVVAIADLIW